MIGEFGYTIVKKDDPLCFCGNHGCLEVLCSVDMVILTCTELIGKGKCGILDRILKHQE